MQQSLKRGIDIAGAAIGLILTAPILALTAFAIRLVMGTPCLFHQARGGFRGRVFYVCKFRTMTAARDPSGNLFPDAERLTPLGRFIRNTSIDELPQLWNVLRGDMSLVGPRPLMAKYLDRYEDWQRRRHLVKPGLTGWAQINGRNAITWEERFHLDVWYVDNCSLALDCRILLRTVLSVLRRDGIRQANHATMPEFVRTYERSDGF